MDYLFVVVVSYTPFRSVFFLREDFIIVVVSYLLQIMFKLILIYTVFAFVQCDLTNLNEILTLLKQNTSKVYSIGFMTEANRDVTKRYLPANMEPKIIENKTDVIKALDDETIIGNDFIRK